MGKTPKLRARDVGDVPLRELSGLAVHGSELLAVGDHDPVLLRAPLPAWPLSWQAVDLSGLGLADGGIQFEAVESAGGTGVLVLQEQPARILHLRLADLALRGSIHLEVPAGHPVHESWLGDRSSRGESLVLTGSGHVLVVKEKNPAVILEFGPAGAAAGGWRRGIPGAAPGPGDATWTVLASWWPTAGLADLLGDISDATVGPDGRLYLLSDQGGAIARLPDELNPGGGEVDAAAVWRIAGSPAKAEGLVILDDGTPLVALDTRSPHRNLLRLEPLPLD